MSADHRIQLRIQRTSTGDQSRVPLDQRAGCVPSLITRRLQASKLVCRECRSVFWTIQEKFRQWVGYPVELLPALVQENLLHWQLQRP